MIPSDYCDPPSSKESLRNCAWNGVGLVVCRCFFVVEAATAGDGFGADPKTA